VADKISPEEAVVIAQFGKSLGDRDVEITTQEIVDAVVELQNKFNWTEVETEAVEAVAVTIANAVKIRTMASMQEMVDSVKRSK